VGSDTPGKAGAVAMSLAIATCLGVVAAGMLAPRLAPSLPLVLAGLAATGLLAVAQVSRVRRQEGLARRALEERIDATLKAAQDLVWAVDGDGRVTYAGSAARELFGCEPDELVGTPLLGATDPARAAEEARFLAHLKRGETPAPIETTRVRPDGRRVQIRVAASPLRDGGGRVLGAVGTAAEIGHLREMERRLAQMERMHAIGALAGGVAHDFKNLLTVIVGQAEIAKGLKETGPAVARKLDSILDTAHRGRNLVEQILVFARERNVRREVIDLGALLRGLEEMLRRLLQREMTLELALPEDTVLVRADRGQIEQIVINLVVNARDASPDRAPIRITLAAGELGAKRVRDLGIPEGNWAVLQVIDKGCGMTPEVRSRIFEPFFTTKEKGKGTGLGLATVHGFVHQHGGTISVRSEPGRGTRMAVLLPLVPASDETPVRAHAETVA